ncbi:MAG: 16S rRNA (guanine(527)-N(7))-methyltransferase RsmG [Schwartzia sp. (in: firmicutes)]
MNEVTRSFCQAAEVYGLSLTDKQVMQFDRYAMLLLSWNEKMNLTAIVEPTEVAVKHFIDAASVWRADWFTAEIRRVVDVGTGAGFPGLPLKILHPELDVTLMDALQKRVRFLSEVIEALGLTGVVAVHARAEEGARQKIYRERFDAAVSRAVAPLAVLAEYTLPFVRVGGFLAAQKGAKYAAEAQEGAKALALLGGAPPVIASVKLPGFDDTRAVLYVEKVRPTPDTYPRKAGTPEKKPLG